MKSLRELAALTGIFLAIALILHAWPTLPPVIPSRFDLHGAPVAYAPKSTLWIFVAVQISIYLFLLVVSRFPRAFNLPKPAGDPGRPRLEAITIQMLGWLRLETAWIFTYIALTCIHAARDFAAGISIWFLFLPTVIIGGTVAFFLWRMHTLEPRQVQS